MNRLFVVVNDRDYTTGKEPNRELIFLDSISHIEIFDRCCWAVWLSGYSKVVKVEGDDIEVLAEAIGYQEGFSRNASSVLEDPQTHAEKLSPPLHSSL